MGNADIPERTAIDSLDQTVPGDLAAVFRLNDDLLRVEQIHHVPAGGFVDLGVFEGVELDGCGEKSLQKAPRIPPQKFPSRQRSLSTLRQGKLNRENRHGAKLIIHEDVVNAAAGALRHAFKRVAETFPSRYAIRRSSGCKHQPSELSPFVKEREKVDVEFLQKSRSDFPQIGLRPAVSRKFDDRRRLGPFPHGNLKGFRVPRQHRAKPLQHGTHFPLFGEIKLSKDD